MSPCWKAKAMAVSLCYVLALPVAAQTPVGDRTPRVSYSPGWLGPYKPGSVTGTDFRDSRRIDDLIRAGQLYLSLQDAIALALENNLDLELERYGLRMAATDTYRAQGGGVLRGVPLLVNETSAGVGGPGSPLLTSAATGVLSQTNIPVNVTDTQLIAEGADNLGTTGTFGFASGPVIPLFDPLLSGNLTGLHSNLPQTSLANTGTTSLTDNSFYGNAAWTQGFSYGTQIAAGFQSQYNSENNVRNLFAPYDTSTLGITVTQPLLRGFGAELNQRFIHIAKNSEKISDYVFQAQIISTISGVIRLYYDLVALDEDQKVKLDTLATAQRLYQDNMNKVEQGTLAPIEATRAEAQVSAARQDQINSDGLVRQQEVILKNVLSRNWGSDPLLHDARIVPTDTVTVEPLPTQSPTEIVAQAIANRPEYQAAKLQLTNTEISLKGTKNELRPELDLFGNIQNNGLAGPGNPALVPLPAGVYNGLGGGYGTALGQLFKFDYPTYSVGLNLTLPVHNRVAQADVARDELQVRQTEVRLRQLENQIRVEAEDALIALGRTRAAYQAAVDTRKLQEESLQIEQEKLDVGLSTVFLVIQVQSYVAQARSTEVAALDAYAQAKTQFERAIGQTLPIHNVSIDEAMRGESTRVSSPLPPPAAPAPGTPARQ
jgi:outer membrane protein TolC